MRALSISSTNFSNASHFFSILRTFEKPIFVRRFDPRRRSPDGNGFDSWNR